MKTPITIMKPKPELPDEEIRSYMDFDRLVADQQLALRMNKKYTVMKWLLAAITLMVLTGGSLYFFKSQPAKIPAASTKADETVAVAPSQPNPAPEETPKESATVPLRKDDDVMPIEKKQTKKPEAVIDEKATTSTNPEPPAAKDEHVYVQAEPVNGYAVLYGYFNDNLVYPAVAIKDSIQGVETISFVITAEGKAEKLEIKQSLGTAFDQEARRLVAGMPAWKPATLNGKPVPSVIALPITFQVQRIKSKD